MKFAARWLVISLGIAFLAVLVSLQWGRIVRGENDFAALYAGGKLAGTPDLYARTANEVVIRSVLGTTMPTVIYTRPPFYAALLKPLAALPYPAAYRLFLFLDVCSILWFLWRFSKECSALLYFAAFSIPLAAFLPQGQDAPLLLTFAGLSILLARNKKDFPAGLIFSLCAIKFHLFLLIPFLLLIKRKWSILAGAAVGAFTLFLLGIAVAGIDSTSQYIAALRNPWINFRIDMMPSLHGLVGSLYPSTSLEMGLSFAVAAVFLWICYRTDDYELLFALGLIGSLLISYHSGLSDDNLLLLCYVLIAKSQAAKYVKIALAIALTPIPYAMGVSLGVPLAMLVVLGLAAASLIHRTRAAHTIVPAVA